MAFPCDWERFDTVSRHVAKSDAICSGLTEAAENPSSPPRPVSVLTFTSRCLYSTIESLSPCFTVAETDDFRASSVPEGQRAWTDIRVAKRGNRAVAYRSRIPGEPAGKSKMRRESMSRARSSLVQYAQNGNTAPESAWSLFYGARRTLCFCC